MSDLDKKVDAIISRLDKFETRVKVIMGVIGAIAALVGPVLSALLTSLAVKVVFGG